jgi:hypothetical protein
LVSKDGLGQLARPRVLSLISRESVSGQSARYLERWPRHVTLGSCERSSLKSPLVGGQAMGPPDSAMDSPSGMWRSYISLPRCIPDCGGKLCTGGASDAGRQLQLLIEYRIRRSLDPECNSTSPEGTFRDTANSFGRGPSMRTFLIAVPSALDGRSWEATTPWGTGRRSREPHGRAGRRR